MTSYSYSDISQKEIGLIEQTMMDFIRENFDFCEEEVKKVENLDPYIADDDYWNWSEEDHRHMIISDVLEEIFENDLFVNYITEHAGVSDFEELYDYYSIGNMISLYKGLKREKMIALLPALLPGLLGRRVDANIATIIYDFCN
jgi:hypothetical protein